MGNKPQQCKWDDGKGEEIWGGMREVTSPGPMADEKLAVKCLPKGGFS